VALVVFDASVFIALLDRGDAHHAAAVSAVAQVRSDALVLPASAYATTDALDAAALTCGRAWTHVSRRVRVV
jgi:predicted nucleic acid-binding protein